MVLMLLLMLLLLMMVVLVLLVARCPRRRCRRLLCDDLDRVVGTNTKMPDSFRCASPCSL